MELPRRTRGDELLKPGELLDLRRRLERISSRHDLTTVIACAFDHRTRMLPFIYADTRMAPAGVRAIGSAMVDAGLPQDPHRPPAVEQETSARRACSSTAASPTCSWSPRWACTPTARMEMIRDARRIEPANRPLIIAGGSHAVYEPCLFSATTRSNSAGAPTSSSPVKNSSCSASWKCILSVPRRRRIAALRVLPRARDAGARRHPRPHLPLGARVETEGVAEELVDTGIQRLLGDLDELPHPVLGYQLLEAPSRAEYAQPPQPSPPTASAATAPSAPSS